METGGGRGEIDLFKKYTPLTKNTTISINSAEKRLNFTLFLLGVAKESLGSNLLTPMASFNLSSNLVMFCFCLKKNMVRLTEGQSSDVKTRLSPKL